MKCGAWLVVLGLTLAPALRAEPVQKSESGSGAEKREGEGAYLGAYITEDPDRNGIVVDHTVPDDPAYQAGIVRGDKIMKIGDKKISSREDVYDALARCKPGQKIVIVIKRGEKEMKKTVTLGAKKPGTHDDG